MTPPDVPNLLRLRTEPDWNDKYSSKLQVTTEQRGGELSVPLDTETINRNNLALVFTARKYSKNICLVTSLDTVKERPIDDSQIITYLFP